MVSKKQQKSPLSLPILLLLCIVFFAFAFVTYKLLRHNQSHISGITSSSSVLVFMSSQTDTPGSPMTDNITDTNGRLIKSIYVTQEDSNYAPFNGYRSYSKGLLASNEIYKPGEPVSVTRWSILKPDGSIFSIAPSLVTPLNSTFDLSRTNSLSTIFVIPHNRIVALIYPSLDDESTARFSVFDLATGNEKQLLTISPANNTYFPHILPEDINQSGNTISFLVSNVRINTQTIQGTATVLYNLETNSLTVNYLPTGLAEIAETKWTDQYPQGNPTVGVSTDGKIIVYQSPYIATRKDGNVQLWKTHVFNLNRQKDITAATDIALPGGYSSYFFSQDNSYFILYFENRMDIVRAQDGHIIQSFTLGIDPNNPDPSKYLYNIEPIGWIDNKTLAYTTARSDTLGLNNFTVEKNVTSHAVNVVTHQVYDYPQALGRLTAIIYK